jgi:predicted transcriptional regulator
MTGKTVNVGARVSPEIRDELSRIAKAERRTISQLVSFAIEEWLERRRKGARS